LARAASVLGVRVIASDRPGFGHSTAHEARTLVDWPKDVEAIADHLGLERFGVIGLSGGGPHAMATAWGMPERVTSLVVVASAPLPELESQTRDVGLPFRMIAKVTRYAPWAMRFILDDQRKMASAAPEELLERTRGGVGEADARWLADEEGGALFAASMRVAYREGIDGSLQEHQLYRRAWGFQLQDIVVPTTFFIGDEDVLASRRVNEQMATSVPNARFEIIEGEGHLSLIPRRARRVLAAALQQQ
jgi:pimeloyl-ACP methyl ester carboxylesterase